MFHGFVGPIPKPQHERFNTILRNNNKNKEKINDGEKAWPRSNN